MYVIKWNVKSRVAVNQDVSKESEFALVSFAAHLPPRVHPSPVFRVGMKDFETQKSTLFRCEQSMLRAA